MLNSMEQTLEVEDSNNRGSEPNPNQSQEWETMVRLWFSAFFWSESVSRYLTLSSSSSKHYEPSGCHFFPHQAPETYQVGASHARFQRTDQWLPVYSWLESLDKDEVVKSRDISDWLAENPEIREQLCF
ncbi:WD40 REPEAT PROTEIN [Salix koriyanagi]|uniref:WD40 REPEAT PROTEIN n=1 Tax=Salix koriyanagi TaxID=2511006 RepID=A0A9Q1AAC7_9ROSI|nr:WD40 REPEAT PROTEIN [Salix koriyanagi]